MIKSTTLAALVILVLMTGCQKDQVEECLKDLIAGEGAAYQIQNNELKAMDRAAFRMACMQAAAGQK